LVAAGSGYDLMMGFCDDGIASSGSIKAGDLLTSRITVNYARKTLYHGSG